MKIGPHAVHDDARDADPFERAAVHHFQRNAGQAGVVNRAVRDDDVLEAAVRFGAQLEGVARPTQHAIGDDHILRGAVRAGLQRDGVVAGNDFAVGDAHPLGAIDVDAVVVRIYAAMDVDAADLHLIAGQVVLHPHGRVFEADISDRDIAAAHETHGERTHFVGALESGALSIDRAAPANADVLQTFRVNEALLRVRVRKGTQGWHERWIVLKVLAAEQHRAGVQMERHPALQDDGPG
jgi:hypothetical protein